MRHSTIKSRISKAQRDGMLVELDLADGTAYSGYEVEDTDVVGPNGKSFVVTYGDYPDERDGNAVVVPYDAVVAVELI